jgi:hypothetical protein
MERRLAEGDFSKRETPEYKPDEKTIEARRKVRKTRMEYNKALIKHQREADKFWRDGFWGSIRRERSVREGLAKGVEVAAATTHLSRAILTSFDYSAAGRQGFLYGVAHPLLAVSLIPKMVKAGRSQRVSDAIMEEIMDRPNWDEYDKAGLFISDINDGSMNKAEEEYQSRLINEADGLLGHLVSPVKGSQRAYTTYLNLLRVEAYDKLKGAVSLSAGGELNTEQMEAIANFVNVSTGRGRARDHNVAATLKAASQVFFSPRLVMSRFQYAAGLVTTIPGTQGSLMYGGDKHTTKVIAKENARTMLGIATFLSLAAMAGADIEDDPRSSDFLQIRIGRMRIDILAGLRPMMVFVYRLARGQKLDKHGAVVELDGSIWGQNRATLAGRFARTKVSPPVGLAFTVLSGKTFSGEKLETKGDWAKAIAEGTVIPMPMTDAIEGFNEYGVGAAAAASILAVIGVGVNTYSENKPKKSRSRSGPRAPSAAAPRAPTASTGGREIRLPLGARDAIRTVRA